MSAQFEFRDDEETQEILGIRDIQPRMIRDGSSVQAVARRRCPDFDGDDKRVEAAGQAVDEMRAAQRSSGNHGPEDAWVTVN